MAKSSSLLELKVLAIIRARRNYNKYKYLVPLDFFKIKETRLLFRTIVNYHEKIKGDFLSLQNLWIMIEKVISEEDHYLYRGLIKKMKYDDDIDEKVINLTIIRFAQESMLKSALDETISQIGRASDLNLDELNKKIKRIISLNGKPTMPDYDYVSQREERHTVTAEPSRLPTGLSGELDRHLRGGLGAGELGFILAPPGRGKTLSLVNVGANALRLGKRVLHVTLEIKARIVAKRYDCCLADATLDTIIDDPSILTKKLKAIQATGAKLVIKDYSYEHCGIADLNIMLENYAEEKESFDLLIVDYGDLMVPPQKYTAVRHEITKIYEELRILAGKYNIPVWTASQSNRASLNKRVIRMDDIAEAFAKANIADLILALCQSEDEKQEKLMRIFVAKTRQASTNPIVQVYADPDKMIIKSLKRDEGGLSVTNRIKQIKSRTIGGPNKVS